VVQPVAADAPVLLQGQDIRVQFARKGSWFRRLPPFEAVKQSTLALRRGETLGLVGESGCGKSTTARAILRRVPLTSGRIRFAGQDITEVEGETLRQLRKGMQLVFQDPYASLNPRLRVLEIIAEPLLVHGEIKKLREAEDRVAERLELVGLPPEYMFRYPHAFSGGQRQRINIARALSLEPDFVVADEPVSALDVSIRAQVVNLLQDIQERLGITYLFIGHDLSVVRHISHRIAVMYAGKIVEVGTRDEIYENPKHPYTQALLSAVPIPDPRIEATRKRISISGAFPDLLRPPGGCRFHTRCPIAVERCSDEEPPLESKNGAHRAACWLT
jgi:peptide/nickel transport system ATP-binding protein